MMPLLKGSYGFRPFPDSGQNNPLPAASADNRHAFLLRGSRGTAFLRREGSSAFLLCGSGHAFATTGDFQNDARNHCAATTVLNLLLLSGAAESPQPGTAAARALFLRVHRYIGNGPVFRLAPKATRLFRAEQIPLTAEAVSPRQLRSSSGSAGIAAFIAGELRRGNYCAVMVEAAVFAWHWVLVTGYKAAENGGTVLLVEDNWHRRSMQEYVPDNGSIVRGICVFHPLMPDK